MRHDPTVAEAKLWTRLRDRRLGGYKFRRQRPTVPFVADFSCLQLLLVVEIDGDSRGDRVAYDGRRTQRLQRDGYHVVRFTNDDAIHNLPEVLEEIRRECERLDNPKAPSP